MPHDLLDDAQVHSLIDRDRACCVPATRRLQSAPASDLRGPLVFFVTTPTFAELECG